MDDFCPIARIDHLEFHVGNARQAGFFYANCLGFVNTAYRGLETGARETASYVMQQGDICFVLTSPLVPDNDVARLVARHGDGVGVIGLEVPDAAAAFREATRRGASPRSSRPNVETKPACCARRRFTRTATPLIKFVERDGYRGAFAPGFRSTGKAAADLEGVGLTVVDHIVGNVELGAMDTWVRFFAETMGFTQLVHFDDKSISTEYSALMSKVMQDGTGRVKFPDQRARQGEAQVADPGIPRLLPGGRRSAHRLRHQGHRRDRVPA